MTRSGNFSLPAEPADPWLLPREPEHTPLIARLAQMPTRLSDWGYAVSTGPLVWNRHKGQLRSTPCSGAYPLIWAEAVTPDGRFLHRALKRNHQPYFRIEKGDDWLKTSHPCVLVQRITAREQRRRLIAAELPASFVAAHGAVVIENHLNMVRPSNGPPKVSPAAVAALLNSEVVDRAFRCISGSVAVSAYELEALPLPGLEDMKEIEALVACGRPREAIEQRLRAIYFGEDHAGFGVRENGFGHRGEGTSAAVSHALATEGSLGMMGTNEQASPTKTTELDNPQILTLRDSIIFEGDALTVLQRLPDASVQCVVTSPPYWGLRDYNHTSPDQIGLESTLPQFINRLTEVFREARRVLKDDGILWLNIGDGYTSGNRGWRAPDKKNRARAMTVRPDTPDGLKPKDLLGVPWRLAFSLQEDGWYLRADIIWNKPNAMPESVKDRPTRSHEYLFMFTKSERYKYDRAAILDTNGRNRRSVWDVNTQGFSGAHFATFPPRLIEPCILASTEPGDVVLDPFFGAGTVGVVAQQHKRRYMGIELHPDYVALAARRLEAGEYSIIRIAA